MTSISELIAEMEAGLEGTTPGKWDWLIHDHSMASLGVLPDPGMGNPLVLCVSPCEACAKRADGSDWKWGRCHTPSAKDAAHIVRCSPDNIAAIIAGYREMGALLREALAALEFAKRQILPPARRIKGQNDAFCDGYEMLIATAAHIKKGLPDE